MPDTGSSQADKAKVLLVLEKPGMRALLSKMLELGPCINSFDLEQNVPVEKLQTRLSDLRAVGLVQGEIVGAPCFCVNQKTLARIQELTHKLDQPI